MIQINAKTIGAATVSALVLYLVARSEFFKAAKNVGEAVNPVSDQNIFYGGANAVTRVLTGDQDTTLGGAIYDSTHNADGSFKWPWEDPKPSATVYVDPNQFGKSGVKTHLDSSGLAQGNLYKPGMSGN